MSSNAGLEAQQWATARTGKPCQNDSIARRLEQVLGPRQPAAV